MKTRTQSLYLLLPVLFIIASCGNNDQKKSGPPPTQIQSYPVVALKSQSTTLETDYPATLEGIQNIDIRPKVDGFIEKIYVDEGATVKKGQPLFNINAPQ